MEIIITIIVAIAVGLVAGLCYRGAEVWSTAPIEEEDWHKEVWYLDRMKCVGDVATDETLLFEIECGFPPHQGTYDYVVDQERYEYEDTRMEVGSDGHDTDSLR